MDIVARQWVRVCRTVLLILIVFSASAGRAAEAFDAARKTYLEHCESIVAAREKRNAAAVSTCREALKRLQAAMRKRGDLDGWQAAKRETERFERGHKLDKSRIDSSAPELKALLDAFLEAREASAQEAACGILSLSDKYLGHLKKLEQDLTKAGKMGDAIACRAEARRVEKSPRVSAARFETAEREARQVSRAKGKAKGPANGKPSGKVAGALAAEDVPAPIIAGCMVHHGQSPDLTGIFLKPFSLRPTPRGRVARQVSAQAESGNLSTPSAGASQSYLSSYYSYYYGKSKSESTDTMVRVRVRASQPVENISVVIQLYSRPVGVPGNVMPDRAGLYRIPLESLDREWVTIDCPPVSTSKSRSRTSYYSSTQKSGSEFFGMAVTALDANGGLLFEGVSSSTLTAGAECISNRLTREELVAKLQADVERTRERHIEAASNASRKPKNKKLKTARTRAKNAYDKARAAYEEIQGAPAPPALH
jgi:hypothetical protein